MDNLDSDIKRKRHRTQSADKENKKANMEHNNVEIIHENVELGDNEDTEQTKEMAGTQTQQEGICNTSLQDIATSLSSLHNKFDDLKLQQGETETGLSNVKSRVNTIEEDSAQCTSDITILKIEGSDCKNEIKLLKALVIKQSDQIKKLQNECADLRLRSMKNNVLFHNLPEVSRSKEDCEETISNMLEDSGFEGSLDIDRAHRLGKANPENKFPRPIVVRLVAQKEAQSLIEFGKTLPKGKNKVKITPQYPSDIYEQRKQMGERIGEVKKETGVAKPRVQMTHDKLIIDGVTQHDIFPAPSSRSLLNLSPHEKESIAKNPPILHKGKPMKESGNIFVACAARVHDKSQAIQAYRKALLDPVKASAAHNMAIYRLRPDPSNPANVQEAYQDDGEIGAGRHLRYLLQRRNAVNVVVFVTRHYSGQHLGAKRWDLIDSVVDSALAELKNHEDSQFISKPFDPSSKEEDTWH